MSKSIDLIDILWHYQLAWPIFSLSSTLNSYWIHHLNRCLTCNSYAVAPGHGWLAILQAKWANAWSWRPLNRPAVGPQKGVQWQKTAWHVWATIGGGIPTESRSGTTECSLVCRTIIAHCNRQFLTFKFCSSQCRHVLHCHRTDCRSYILNLDFW